MELIFVRHALPLRREGSEGPADPPLAPEGWNQARKLAEWLRGEHIHGVIVSPSRRAYETAVPLAEMRGLEPVVDDALAEFDHGAASYVPFEELRKLGDARWEALSRGEFINTSVDPVEFRRRIVNRIEEIIAANPGRRLVISTHAGVINAYLGRLLAQEPPLWFGPGYASISRVAGARDGKRGVISLNETGHVA